MSEDVKLPNGSSFEITQSNGFNITTVDEKDINPTEPVFVVLKRMNGFGMVTGEYRIIKEDGKMILAKVIDEIEDENQKRALAKIIVESHKEEIMEQIPFIVEEALLRKPIKKLQKLEEESKDIKKKGLKSKLKTFKGCVELNIGTEATIL